MSYYPESWEFRELCKNDWVEVSVFLQTLKKIFPNLMTANREEPAKDIFHTMRKANPFSEDDRFVDGESYISMGDNKIIEKMDAIRGLLIIISELGELRLNPNFGFAEIKLLKETFDDLQKIISSLRDIISQGQGVYDREVFETKFNWRYDDDYD